MSNYIVDFFFLVAGGMFLFVGIKIRNNHKRISSAGIWTEALIIQFVEEIGHDTNDNHIGSPRYHYPVVQFTDEDGQETIQRLYSTANPNLLNEYINICYIKHEDGEYEIVQNTKFMGSQFPMIFIALGGFMMLAGVIRLISWEGLNES